MWRRLKPQANSLSSFAMVQLLVICKLSVKRTCLHFDKRWCQREWKTKSNQSLLFWIIPVVWINGLVQFCFQGKLQGFERHICLCFCTICWNKWISFLFRFRLLCVIGLTKNQCYRRILNQPLKMRSSKPFFVFSINKARIFYFCFELFELKIESKRQQTIFNATFKFSRKSQKRVIIWWKVISKTKKF